MRAKVVPVLVAVAFSGCLSAPTPPSAAGPDGSTSASGGSGQSTGGATGSGGTTGSGGGSGGSLPGTGGTSSGGNTGTGGVATGGSSSGGGSGSGGATGTGGSGSGGRMGTGGMMAGSGGEAPGSGGMTPGSGGMMAGSGGRVGSGGMGGSTMAGSGGMSGGNPWTVVDGLRLDDTCGTLLSGNVCLHQGKPSDNGTPFMAMKAVTMGGTIGTTYMVKIQIRGVVEPTHIMGGTTGTPTTFVTGGNRYADGTNESTYQQWRLTTSVPNQHYYLNVYNSDGLSHVVHTIDETETIPIGGGSTVTLDVYDGNAHAISNTANPVLTISGVPGSMNSGQFVQVNVVSGM